MGDRDETIADPPAHAPHLRRLAQASPLLADLARADILILEPNNTAPDGDHRPDAQSSSQHPSPTPSFTVTHHVRPINARTMYPIDEVGSTLTFDERPLAARAFRSGRVMDGGVFLAKRGRWIRTLAVPVRHDNRVVAVLAREYSPQVEVMPGDLELLCFATFRRIATMIEAGSFPFGADTRSHDHPPRVGDGVMLFDRAGRLDYASPNALTVLRQVGATGVNLAQRFGDMGIDAPGFSQAYANRLAYTDEVEVGSSVLSLYTLPILTRNVVTGALVLVRNISELRQRDRLLMTKNATIAEIHHRVKNSLQTVSSLLQLQSRRSSSGASRQALDEAVRRIRSISVVHELLSHRTDDEVHFGEIVDALVAMIRESLMDPEQPVELEVTTNVTVLPNNLTTPLALVISELTQNALSHASATNVQIALAQRSGEIEVQVRDDGVGFPEGFRIADSAGLGLTIVRTLVEGELSGRITIADDATDGATVTVTVPRFDEARTP